MELAQIDINADITGAPIGKGKVRVARHTARRMIEAQIMTNLMRGYAKRLLQPDAGQAAVLLQRLGA